MRKKQLISLALVSSMIVSATSCGLYKSSDETRSEEKTTTVNNSGETAEKITLHHGDDESKSNEETTAKETDGEPHTSETDEQGTEPEKQPEEENPSEKYVKLMSLSREEALEYFEVEVDESLSAEDFEKYLDDLFYDYLGSNVIAVKNYYDNVENAGLERDELDYTLYSLVEDETALADSKAAMLEDLKNMLAFPYDKLTDRQKLVYDKFYYEDLIGIWSYDVTNYSNPLSSIGGFVPNMAITFYEYTFGSEQDVEDYLKALKNVPDALEQVYIGVEKKIDEENYYPTDYMLKENIDSIEGLEDIETTPFIYAFNEKIDECVKSDKAKEYKEQNEKIYTEEIVPALKSLKTKLNELLGKNEDGKGLVEYPGGLEYYKFLLEDKVGNLMPMEKVFEMLESDLSDKLKIEEKTLSDNYLTMVQFFTGLLSADSIEGLSPSEMIENLKKNLKGDYPSIDDVEYDVAPLPKSIRQDGIMAYYILPGIDVSGKNVIRYNPDSLQFDTILTYSTLAHEGYPGHMLQFNIEKDSNNYKIESLIGHLGYTEGWAMSVEEAAINSIEGLKSCVKEYYNADSDVSYDLYGIFDIGFNGLGWTIKDAKKFIQKYDLQLEEDDIKMFRNVVIADPTVYLSYSVGRIITDDILNEYEKNHTAYEANKAFCEVGPASFNVVRKYMGLE